MFKTLLKSTNFSSKSKIVIWYPLILLLYNLISKALYLTDRDIGLDEPFTIYHAQFSFSQIVDILKNYNNPPLFELLLHYWIKLFGISPQSVRVLPLIFASLSPLALYYFGKRFFSVKTGIVSSLLLSFSYIPVYFAHDTRVYSLFLLLSIISMHYFLLLSTETKIRWGVFVTFIISTSLLIYAHYFGFFILFFQIVYLLFFCRHLVWRFAACYGGILFFYLPHLYPLLMRASDSVKAGTWIEPPSGIESLYNMLWSFSNFPFITVLCICLLVFSLVKFLRRPLFINNYKNTTLIVFWFLFAYIGMFFISFKVPMYITRYLIYALPAYYILLAICINYLFENIILNRIILLVLLVSFACTTELNPDKHQYIASRVAVIRQLKDTSTLIIVAPQDYIATFAYHYNRAFFSEVNDGKEYVLTDSLLQNDHVYMMNEAFELAKAHPENFKKILYYGAGALQANADSPLLKTLSQKYNRYYFEKFSDGHVLSIFKVK